MAYKYVTLETDGAICRLTLNRPDKLNAINPPMEEELEGAIEETAKNSELKVLILKGAGRAFCSGYDLRGGPFTAEEPMTVAEHWVRETKMARRAINLWEMPVISIAQVQGYALAAGLFLALQCDLVIAAEGTKFGNPPTRFGAVPGGMWPLFLGPRRAKELMLTGSTIDAHRAEQIGLVNRVVPAEALEKEVEDLAQSMAKVRKESLTLNKAYINSFFDILGAKTAASASGLPMHILSHLIGGYEAFGKAAKEKGLKEALKDRDSEFDKK